MIKKILFQLLLAFIAISSSFAGNFDVVARVNNDVITRYDLNAYLQDNKGTKTKVLNDLINTRLKQQAIDKENISLDAKEFEYYLELVQQDKNIQNIDESSLKINYLWSKLINEKIKRTVVITRSEVNDALEYINSDSIEESYNISQIVIDKKQNQDLNVEKLYRQIKKQNNFEAIAKTFNGSNIGWINKNDLNPKIYRNIKNLPIGTVTKPLSFEDYYLIVRLNDKKQERIALESDLTNARRIIYEKKLALKMQDYLNTLRNNSFIKLYI